MTERNGHRRVIVIGVGNEFRGDDALGFEVLRRIQAERPESVDLFSTDGDGALLMQRWADYDTAYIVDCVTSGAPAGTRFRLDAAERRMPTQFFRSSSHLFGVAEAIEMARTLRQLPNTVIVYGAEGTQLELGQPISPEVQHACLLIASDLLNELRAA